MLTGLTFKYLQKVRTKVQRTLVAFNASAHRKIQHHPHVRTPVFSKELKIAKDENDWIFDEESMLLLLQSVTMCSAIKNSHNYTISTIFITCGYL